VRCFGGMDKKRRGCHRAKVKLTLALYAFEEDGGMDSNEECHLGWREDEVEL
jgi:hypothetical protein